MRSTWMSQSDGPGAPPVRGLVSPSRISASKTPLFPWQLRALRGKKLLSCVRPGLGSPGTVPSSNSFGQSSDKPRLLMGGAESFGAAMCIFADQLPDPWNRWQSLTWEFSYLPKVTELVRGRLGFRPRLRSPCCQSLCRDASQLLVLWWFPPQPGSPISSLPFIRHPLDYVRYIH